MNEEIEGKIGMIVNNEFVPVKTSTKDMLLHNWINYKAMFKRMYGHHILEYYQNNFERLAILKYDILYR